MKDKKREVGPVSDGDSRPDQNDERKSVGKEKTPDKQKNKFSVNRGADRNSLEDYKDAK